jgi:hypothetical protein
MTVVEVKRTNDKIYYWYYATPTAKLLTMKEFYYSHSWLPDLHNLIDYKLLIKRSRVDFTWREFFTELLILITSYQQLVNLNLRNSNWFDRHITAINLQLELNEIDLKFKI